jgi:hypothetical protein
VYNQSGGGARSISAFDSKQQNLIDFLIDSLQQQQQQSKNDDIVWNLPQNKKKMY